jgi:hypothetical protein
MIGIITEEVLFQKCLNEPITLNLKDLNLSKFD